jgi:2-aminoadipate transaminase
VDEAFRKAERAGELHRVKAIYVVSYFDNPSTATLSLERRPQIVELAQRWSRAHTIHVIDDAAYRELRYDGPDLPSLRSFDADGETVIYTHTFSKSFSPGMRVGWGILPASLIEPVCEQKGNLDFGSPHFNQHIMATVLDERLLEPHLERLRQAYRAKRDAMLSALNEHLASLPGVRWARPDGGLYVWLELPAEISAGVDGPLFERALAAGVIYVPGEFCYAAEGVPVARNTIRLSFGVQTPERIREGVKALASALREALTTLPTSH